MRRNKKVKIKNNSRDGNLGVSNPTRTLDSPQGSHEKRLRQQHAHNHKSKVTAPVTRT